MGLLVARFQMSPVYAAAAAVAGKSRSGGVLVENTNKIHFRPTDLHEIDFAWDLLLPTLRNAFICVKHCYCPFGTEKGRVSV